MNSELRAGTVRHHRAPDEGPVPSGRSGPGLRLAVVWTEVPGYLSACLRTLTAHFSVECVVVSNLANRPDSSRRAFSDDLFSWMPRFHRVQHRDWRKRVEEIRTLIWSFQPDVLLTAFQWRYPESYLLVRDARQKGIITIGAMDTPWLGKAKQQLAVGGLRTTKLLKFDAVWVPGERCAQYATRLFGSETPIWRGLYCADTDLFSSSLSRPSCTARPREGFLFAGRLSDEKGISDLLAAYESYRHSVKVPWKLILAGDGPRRTVIEKAGLTVRGFTHPADLAALMRNAGALVLPSWHEPWGVVVHEAALCGLPIVCSDACGASVELVQHGCSGLVHRSRNVRELASCLREISELSVPELHEMGASSTSLARRLNLRLWAATLINGIRDLGNTQRRADGNWRPQSH